METQIGFVIAVGIGLTVGLIFTVLAFVYEPLSLLALRWKKWRAGNKPYCCYMTCFRNAEFGIYGSSGHFEDVTETCAKHVGALLGTPTWLPKMNDHWVVHPL